MFTFEEWKSKLHESFEITMYGCDDDKLYQKYSNMFDEMLNEILVRNDDRFVIEVLKLFSDEEDYGVFESCFRVLSNLDVDLLKECFDNYGAELKQKSSFWYGEIRDIIYS